MNSSVHHGGLAELGGGLLTINPDEKDIPVYGLRTEHDSFGAVEVAADKYWGAQTQRALEHFKIGTEKTPIVFVHALAMVKRIAAEINRERGALDSPRATAIVTAAQEVIDGKYNAHFPLAVWQTGSGTQTNMNVNEVIANRANELMGAGLGAHAPIHPNDHVNMAQSSNDSFPTAMHIALVQDVHRHVLPALQTLHESLLAKQAQFAAIVKIGRTHLQDATPLTLGQEFSGYAAQMASAIERITLAVAPLYRLAQGGTAVGTGLNAPENFGECFARRASVLTHLPFVSAGNKFEALASHDAIVFLHGAIESAATGLFKIASDIRLLGSGPRAGIGELILPENEPGSSIMPGKVNPTQAEAVTMVCARIHGNHSCIAFAASQGHLELNVFKPVIAYSALQSQTLLADACNSFRVHCLDGIEANEKRILELVESSLMLVTALAPKIGYDAAAGIAKAAHRNGTSLREEAIKSGLVEAGAYDTIVQPARMTGAKVSENEKTGDTKKTAPDS